MTRAAQELRFSPAAVSQHITALEKQVGAPLLVRHARGVQPTAAGGLLARHAEELLERLGAAGRELDDLISSAAATVRLGIFASAAVGILPGALAKFEATHPAVAVTIDESDVDVGADRLRGGMLDVAVLFDDLEHLELDRSGLDLTQIGLDPVDIVLHDGHPLAQADTVDLEALSDERWVLARGTTCADLVRRRCRACGFEPDIAMTTDDHAAARSLAAARIGVTAVPRLLGQRSGDGVVVRPLHPAPTRLLYAALASDAAVPPAALALRDAIVTHTVARSLPGH